MTSRRRSGPVSLEAVRQLLFACDADPTPYGRRDAALIQLLAIDQCSKKDVAGLSLAAVSSCLFSLEGERRVREWLSVRGPEPGPLFNALSGKSNGPLSYSAIYLVFARRSLQAGVPPFTPTEAVRTQRALACGVWDPLCCIDSPASCVAPRGAAAQAAVTVDVLRRMSAARRRRATALLNLFAQQLTPPANALTAPWSHLSSQTVNETLTALSPELPLRQLNAVRSCVQLVLRRSQDQSEEKP